MIYVVFDPKGRKFVAWWGMVSV